MISLRRQARKTYGKGCSWCVVAVPQPAAARDESVADESPDRLPTIGVADFLAFHGGTGTILNGNFFNLLAHAAKFRGYFRTKLEATTSQLEARQQRAANNFIAGGFVVNAGAIKKIGEVRQQLGSEKETQSALGTVGTHAVNDVGLAGFERAEQRGIILRIVFEIGILDQDVLAAGISQGGADGRAFTAIFLVKYDGN